MEVIENKILALGPVPRFPCREERESRALHVWSRWSRWWRGSDSRAARGGDADSRRREGWKSDDTLGAVVTETRVLASDLTGWSLVVERRRASHR